MAKMNNTTISDFLQLCELIEELKVTGIYIILGNGRGPQYQSMDQVSSSLKPVMTKINEEHGGSKLLMVYCGIPYQEESSDIATCMLHIKGEFNPYILSVQPRNRGRKTDFVDYIYKYENKKDEKGGLVRELEVCGEKTHFWNFLAVLSTYIGPEFLGLVNAVINISSQGPIGVMELNSAREANLEIIEVAPADPMINASDWRLFDGKLGYEEEENSWFDWDNLALLDNRKRRFSEDSDSEDSDSEDSDSEEDWTDWDNLALLYDRRKKRKIL